MAARLAGLTALSSFVFSLLSTQAAELSHSPTLRLEDICGTCRAERFTQCGDFLEGPAFDRAGNLWMTSVRNGDILMVTADGRCTTVANTGGLPRGLKFHRDGRLFGTDAERGIFVLDPATGWISDYVSQFEGKPFAGANDLVFDEQGGLYFTDPGRGPSRSSLLSPTGAVYYVSAEPVTAIRRVAAGLAFPNGIALGDSGQLLLIAEGAAKRIISIRLTQPGVASFSAVEFQLQGSPTADGMAFDAMGNLYVAHAGIGEVIVLDRDRLLIGTISLPAEAGQMPTNLVFHNNYLYVTEAAKNEVWRVPVTHPGAALFQDR